MILELLKTKCSSISNLPQNTHKLFPHILFRLLKHSSYIKICPQPARKSSVINGSGPSLHPIIHLSTELNNTPLINCTWGTCINVCEHLSQQWQTANEKGPCTRWTWQMEIVTVMKEEISNRGGLESPGAIYFTSSVHRCLLWHFSIKRIRVSEARKWAQLTVRGIPWMDGRLLIKCFYVT